MNLLLDSAILITGEKKKRKPPGDRIISSRDEIIGP